MNDDDTKRFEEILGGLFAAMGKPIPPAQGRRMWAKAFEGIELQDFQTACERFAAERTTYPMPSAVREIAREVAKTRRAHEAVETGDRTIAKDLSSPPEDLGELLSVLTMMSDRHRQIGRVSPEEEAFHRKVLGIDPESMRKRSRPYVADGHPHACARRGCNSPGTMSSSTSGGGPWLCREHFGR